MLSPNRPADLIWKFEGLSARERAYGQLLPVKVKILFFNLLKTRTKSESLFIFILDQLQRKKRAGARQNLREILLFQREFHNEGISN